MQTHEKPSTSPADAKVVVESLLEQMTLAEKIGQMIQPDSTQIEPEDVATYAVGSVLSGGNSAPAANDVQGWANRVREYMQASLQTRLKIPLIYAADCVHGHNNCHGAVVFPHNIGLGATRDALLVERIGAITAREMLACNLHWNFAPCLSVPQDLRWGRIYEGFGSDPALAGQLGAAYTRGLQAEGVAACAKHFVGDGGAEWGTRRRLSWVDFWEQGGGSWMIDQGDVNVDEATFRAVHLAPYYPSIDAGALTVMASFNSWRGLKVHASRYLLTDVLKGEMGFQGFIVSDWMAIHQLSPDMYTCVIQSVNAGLDMMMYPLDIPGFIAALTTAVENGDVPLARVDDAVRRILTVKQRLGLFEQPLTDDSRMSEVGSAAHRAVAREAVRKSLVLLKNENAALPLGHDSGRIGVAGQAADDIGLQCGGWTITWQGSSGDIVPGETLLDALRQTLPDADIDYAADGQLAGGHADVGVVVIAEAPYAEGVGDCESLALDPADIALIERVRAQVDRLVLVIYSGRPLLLEPVEPLCDAIVAAWLPGSEGLGMTDVLCGDYPFTGRLPHAWIASMDQLPVTALSRNGAVPSYPYGFGLT